MAEDDKRAGTEMGPPRPEKRDLPARASTVGGRPRAAGPAVVDPVTPPGTARSDTTEWGELVGAEAGVAAPAVTDSVIPSGTARSDTTEWENLPTEYVGLSRTCRELINTVSWGIAPSVTRQTSPSVVRTAATLPTGGGTDPTPEPADSTVFSVIQAAEMVLQIAQDAHAATANTPDVQNALLKQVHELSKGLQQANEEIQRLNDRVAKLEQPGALKKILLKIMDLFKKFVNFVRKDVLPVIEQAGKDLAGAAQYAGNKVAEGARYVGGKAKEGAEVAAAIGVAGVMAVGEGAAAAGRAVQSGVAAAGRAIQSGALAAERGINRGIDRVEDKALRGAAGVARRIQDGCALVDDAAQRAERGAEGLRNPVMRGYRELQRGEPTDDSSSSSPLRGPRR